MAEKLFMVFNDTDSVYVTYEPVTEEQANKIIADFPKRFTYQGYYLTGNQERIPPEDVALKKVEYDDDDDDYEKEDPLLRAAKHALANLEGIMPEHEPSGDRTHPGWKTIEELKAAINTAKGKPF